MNKKIKGILILSLVAIMTSGLVVGCAKTESSDNDKKSEATDSGTKEPIKKEEAFTILPEETLITKYTKDLLSNYDEKIKDTQGIYDFFYLDKVTNQEVVDKYNLKPLGDNPIARDAYNQVPTMFPYAVNEFMWWGYKNANKTGDFKRNLTKQTQNYLSDVWLDKKDGEYYLTDEFKQLDPNKTFQKYLKENKIEDLQINSYPEKEERLTTITGYTVMTYNINISGKQDGNSFAKDLLIDVMFIPNKSNASGENLKLEMSDFEIAQIRLNTDVEDFTQFDYGTDVNIENLKKSFGF